MQEQKRGKKKKTHSASKFTVGNGIFFKSKTSQITLFVIIGIVLLASIIIAFFALRDKILPETNISLDVRQKMEKCIKDSANEAILEISSHGGYSNDTIISKENILFEETKIPLLCSTSGYGELCTNNEPMLIQNSEKEIKSIITSRIEKCFSDLETQFKKSYS